MSALDEAALRKLTRRALQDLAKVHKVKANLKSTKIISELLQRFPDGIPTSHQEESPQPEPGSTSFPSPPASEKPPHVPSPSPSPPPRVEVANAISRPRAATPEQRVETPEPRDATPEQKVTTPEERTKTPEPPALPEEQHLSPVEESADHSQRDNGSQEEDGYIDSDPEIAALRPLSPPRAIHSTVPLFDPVYWSRSTQSAGAPAETTESADAGPSQPTQPQTDTQEEDGYIDSDPEIAALRPLSPPRVIHSTRPLFDPAYWSRSAQPARAPTEATDFAFAGPSQPAQPTGPQYDTLEEFYIDPDPDAAILQPLVPPRKSPCTRPLFNPVYWGRVAQTAGPPIGARAGPSQPAQPQNDAEEQSRYIDADPEIAALQLLSPPRKIHSTRPLFDPVPRHSHTTSRPANAFLAPASSHANALRSSLPPSSPQDSLSPSPIRSARPSRIYARDEARSESPTPEDQVELHVQAGKIAQLASLRHRTSTLRAAVEKKSAQLNAERALRLRMERYLLYAQDVTREWSSADVWDGVLEKEVHRWDGWEEVTESEEYRGHDSNALGPTQRLQREWYVENKGFDPYAAPWRPPTPPGPLPRFNVFKAPEPAPRPRAPPAPAPAVVPAESPSPELRPRLLFGGSSSAARRASSSANAPPALPADHDPFLDSPEPSPAPQRVVRRPLQREQAVFMRRNPATGAVEVDEAATRERYPRALIERFPQPEEADDTNPFIAEPSPPALACKNAAPSHRRFFSGFSTNEYSGYVGPRLAGPSVAAVDPRNSQAVLQIRAKRTREQAMAAENAEGEGMGERKRVRRSPGLQASEDDDDSSMMDEMDSNVVEGLIFPLKDVDSEEDLSSPAKPA